MSSNRHNDRNTEKRDKSENRSNAPLLPTDIHKSQKPLEKNTIEKTKLAGLNQLPAILPGDDVITKQPRQTRKATKSDPPKEKIVSKNKEYEFGKDECIPPTVSSEPKEKSDTIKTRAGHRSKSVPKISLLEKVKKENIRAGAEFIKADVSEQNEKAKVFQEIAKKIISNDITDGPHNESPTVENKNADVKKLDVDEVTSVKSKESIRHRARSEPRKTSVGDKDCSNSHCESPKKNSVITGTKTASPKSPRYKTNVDKQIKCNETPVRVEKLHKKEHAESSPTRKASGNNIEKEEQVIRSPQKRYVVSSRSNSLSPKSDNLVPETVIANNQPKTSVDSKRVEKSSLQLDRKNTNKNTDNLERVDSSGKVKEPPCINRNTEKRDKSEHHSNTHPLPTDIHKSQKSPEKNTIEKTKLTGSKQLPTILPDDDVINKQSRKTTKTITKDIVKSNKLPRPGQLENVTQGIDSRDKKKAEKHNMKDPPTIEHSRLKSTKIVKDNAGTKEMKEGNGGARTSQVEEVKNSSFKSNEVQNELKDIPSQIDNTISHKSNNNIQREKGISAVNEKLLTLVDTTLGLMKTEETSDQPTNQCQGQGTENGDKLINDHAETVEDACVPDIMASEKCQSPRVFPTEHQNMSTHEFDSIVPTLCSSSPKKRNPCRSSSNNRSESGGKRDNNNCSPPKNSPCRTPKSSSPGRAKEAKEPEKDCAVENARPLSIRVTSETEPKKKKKKQKKCCDLKPSKSKSTHSTSSKCCDLKPSKSKSTHSTSSKCRDPERKKHKRCKSQDSGCSKKKRHSCTPRCEDDSCPGNDRFSDKDGSSFACTTRRPGENRGIFQRISNAFGGQLQYISCMKNRFHVPGGVGFYQPDPTIRGWMERLNAYNDLLSSSTCSSSDSTTECLMKKKVKRSRKDDDDTLNTDDTGNEFDQASSPDEKVKKKPQSSIKKSKKPSEKPPEKVTKSEIGKKRSSVTKIENEPLPEPTEPINDKKSEVPAQSFQFEPVKKESLDEDITPEDLSKRPTEVEEIKEEVQDNKSSETVKDDSIHSVHDDNEDTPQTQEEIKKPSREISEDETEKKVSELPIEADTPQAPEAVDIKKTKEYQEEPRTPFDQYHSKRSTGCQKYSLTQSRGQCPKVKCKLLFKQHVSQKSPCEYSDVIQISRRCEKYDELLFSGHKNNACRSPPSRCYDRPKRRINCIENTTSLSPCSGIGTGSHHANSYKSKMTKGEKCFKDSSSFSREIQPKRPSPMEYSSSPRKSSFLRSFEDKWKPVFEKYNSPCREYSPGSSDFKKRSVGSNNRGLDEENSSLTPDSFRRWCTDVKLLESEMVSKYDDRHGSLSKQSSRDKHSVLDDSCITESDSVPSKNLHKRASHGRGRCVDSENETSDTEFPEKSNIVYSRLSQNCESMQSKQYDKSKIEEDDYSDSTIGCPDDDLECFDSDESTDCETTVSKTKCSSIEYTRCQDGGDSALKRSKRKLRGRIVIKHPDILMKRHQVSIQNFDVKMESPEEAEECHGSIPTHLQSYLKHNQTSNRHQQRDSDSDKSNFLHRSGTTESIQRINYRAFSLSPDRTSPPSTDTSLYPKRKPIGISSSKQQKTLQPPKRLHNPCRQKVDCFHEVITPDQSTTICKMETKRPSPGYFTDSDNCSASRKRHTSLSSNDIEASIRASREYAKYDPLCSFQDYSFDEIMNDDSGAQIPGRNSAHSRDSFRLVTEYDDISSANSMALWFTKESDSSCIDNNHSSSGGVDDYYRDEKPSEKQSALLSSGQDTSVFDYVNHFKLVPDAAITEKDMFLDKEIMLPDSTKLIQCDKLKKVDSCPLTCLPNKINGSSFARTDPNAFYLINKNNFDDALEKRLAEKYIGTGVLEKLKSVTCLRGSNDNGISSVKCDDSLNRAKGVQIDKSVVLDTPCPGDELTNIRHEKACLNLQSGMKNTSVKQNLQNSNDMSLFSVAKANSHNSRQYLGGGKDGTDAYKDEGNEDEIDNSSTNNCRLETLAKRKCDEVLKPYFISHRVQGGNSPFDNNKEFDSDKSVPLVSPDDIFWGDNCSNKLFCDSKNEKLFQTKLFTNEEEGVGSTTVRSRDTGACHSLLKLQNPCSNKCISIHEMDEDLQKWSNNFCQKPNKCDGLKEQQQEGDSLLNWAKGKLVNEIKKVGAKLWGSAMRSDCDLARGTSLVGSSVDFTDNFFLDYTGRQCISMNKDSGDTCYLVPLPAEQRRKTMCHKRLKNKYRFNNNEETFFRRKLSNLKGVEKPGNRRERKVTKHTTSPIALYQTQDSQKLSLPSKCMDCKMTYRQTISDAGSASSETCSLPKQRSSSVDESVNHHKPDYHYERTLNRLNNSCNKRNHDGTSVALISQFLSSRKRSYLQKKRRRKAATQLAIKKLSLFDPETLTFKIESGCSSVSSNSLVKKQPFIHGYELDLQEHLAIRESLASIFKPISFKSSFLKSESSSTWKPELLCSFSQIEDTSEAMNKMFMLFGTQTPIRKNVKTNMHSCSKGLELSDMNCYAEREPGYVVRLTKDMEYDTWKSAHSNKTMGPAQANELDCLLKQMNGHGNDKEYSNQCNNRWKTSSCNQNMFSQQGSDPHHIEHTGPPNNYDAWRSSHISSNMPSKYGYVPWDILEKTNVGKESPKTIYNEWGMPNNDNMPSKSISHFLRELNWNPRECTWDWNQNANHGVDDSSPRESLSGVSSGESNADIAVDEVPVQDLSPSNVFYRGVIRRAKCVLDLPTMCKNYTKKGSSHRSAKTNDNEPRSEPLCQQSDIKRHLHFAEFACKNVNSSGNVFDSFANENGVMGKNDVKLDGSEEDFHSAEEDDNMSTCNRRELDMVYRSKGCSSCHITDVCSHRQFSIADECTKRQKKGFRHNCNCFLQHCSENKTMCHTLQQNHVSNNFESLGNTACEGICFSNNRSEQDERQIIFPLYRTLSEKRRDGFQIFQDKCPRNNKPQTIKEFVNWYVIDDEHKLRHEKNADSHKPASDNLSEMDIEHQRRSHHIKAAKKASDPVQTLISGNKKVSSNEVNEKDESDETEQSSSSDDDTDNSSDENVAFDRMGYRLLTGCMHKSFNANKGDRFYHTDKKTDCYDEQQLTKCKEATQKPTSKLRESMPIQGGGELSNFKDNDKWKYHTREKCNRSLGSKSLDEVEVPEVEKARVRFACDKDGDWAELGRGSYGCVYLGLLDGEIEVAIKDFFESSSYDHIIHEAKMLYYLQDTGITPKFYGLRRRFDVKKQPGEFCIIMEYFGDGKTLFNVLSEKTELTTDEWIDVLGQLVAGLRLIHKRNVLLNDLKADNILIDLYGDRKIIRYIDVGMATYKQGLAFQLPQNQMGKYNFLAPEVRNGVHTSKRSDIFSLGYMMDQILRVAGSSLSDLGSLVSYCMDEDPKKRPNVDEIIANVHTFTESSLEMKSTYGKKRLPLQKAV